jgi:hypothetical protein
MKLTKLLTIAFASALLFTVSCTDDNNATNDMYYGNGVLLSNEGNFGKPNADVTFVSSDLNTKQDNIFSSNNGGSNLGDVLQTIAFSGENAYLLLNNSNKIQIVNRYNFKRTGEITSQLNAPRYMTFANNNIYVTNDKYGGDKFVSIYKSSDLSFVKKITFTDNVERIVTAGNYVFVQNASFGFGNKISYISTTNNEIENTITLPSGNINKMIVSNQVVYAIAAGTTDSYIYQISSTGSITKTYTLTGITDATNLEIEKNKIYFTSGLNVYSMDITATTAPTTPLFTVANSVDPYSNLYGFSVVNDRIYTSDANGFTEDSKISIYSTTGSLIKTVTAGKGTNGAYWN